MVYQSEIVIRRTFQSSEASTAPFLKIGLLVAPELSAEAVHVDYVLVRFFDAFALANVFRALAWVAPTDPITYALIDADVTQMLKTAFSDNGLDPYFHGTFGDDRTLRALSALAVDDQAGNRIILRDALPLIAHYLELPGFTVYYRTQGN